MPETIEMPAVDVAADWYCPPDVEEAYEAWHCSCGPAALAALLAKPCRDLRAHFPGQAERGYCNLAQMKSACQSLGLPSLNLRGEMVRKVGDQPCMLRVQFGGPWLLPPVPPAAALRYTHWSAQRGDAIYDVNVGHWCPADQWARRIMPWLGRCLQSSESAWKRWDGTWHVRDTVMLERI